MGEVWVARHVELDAEVALKFSRVEEDFDSQGEQRFRREAQAAARLRSPHIVHIHDFGVHEGRPYIAMELLRGEDLGAVLERAGRVSLGQACEWLGQAGKALRIVHAAGIVHRDIKPSNLFLSEEHGERVVKMLDFGIAKAPRDGTHTTSAGLLLGSPAYMSPEQARGNAVDARSDLWSLSAVFYRMLTGTAPFEGASSGDVLVRVCTEDVAPPSELVPELGADVDRFFRKALARDPARRFPSVEEWLDAAFALAREAGAELGAEERPSAREPRDFRAELDRGGAAEISLPGRTTPTASLRVPAAIQPASPPEPVLDSAAGFAELTQASAEPRRAPHRAALWWGGAGLVAVGIVLAVRSGPEELSSHAASAPPSFEGTETGAATHPPSPATPPDSSARPIPAAQPIPTAQPIPAAQPVPPAASGARAPSEAQHTVAPTTPTPPKRVSPARAPAKTPPQATETPHATKPRPADPVFGLPLAEGP
jgi:serine/threonine-protein kinase